MRKSMLLGALVLVFGFAGVADATSILNGDFTMGFGNWYVSPVDVGGDPSKDGVIRINNPDGQPDYAKFGEGEPLGTYTWADTYEFTAFLSQAFQIDTPLLDIGFEYKFIEAIPSHTFTLAFALKDNNTKALSNILPFHLSPTDWTSYMTTVDLSGVDLTDQKGLVVFLLNEAAATTGTEVDTRALLTNVSVSDAVVPEPATLLLLGSGLIGVGAFVRRKFKR